MDDYLYKKKVGLTIAHITDIHFASNNQNVCRDILPYPKRSYLYLTSMIPCVKENYSNNTLSEVVKDIEKRDFDHIVVTGDLTKYGVKDDYYIVCDILPKKNITFVPGNHDITSKDNINFKDIEGFPRVEVVEGESEILVFICLNSANVPTFLRSGFIGKDQLEEANNKLQELKIDESKNVSKVILIHHSVTNLFNSQKIFSGNIFGKMIEYFVNISDEHKRDLLEFCKENNVRYIFNGHTHYTFQENDPPVCREIRYEGFDITVCNAGSFDLGKSPGYNLYTFNNGVFNFKRILLD